MKLPSKYISKLLLFGFVYYCVGVLSLWFERELGLLPLWPVAGVAAGFIFVWGFRYLPAILVGTTAIALTWHTPLPIYITDTIAQIGETVILVYLLHRFADPTEYFTHLISLQRLIIAAITAVLFAGLAELFYYIVMDMSLNQTAFLSLAHLMVTRSLGILVVIPFMIIWKRPFPTPQSTEIKNELFVIAAINVIALLSAVIILNQSVVWFLPLFFPLPLLIWSSFRFQFHGATATSLFTAILITSIDIQSNLNPLSSSPTDGHLVQISFIAMIAITSLLTAIVLTERDAAQIAFLKSQEHIREQLAFSQTVMNALGQGIFVVDLNDQLEYANPVYAKTIGYTTNELIGKSPKDFIPAPYTQNYKGAMNRQLQGVASSHESALQHKDGHIIPVLVTSAPRLENGRVTGSVVINTDLTERNRAQEIFKLVVSKSPNTTIIVNQKGNIVFTNALVHEMFGYDPEEIIDTPFEVLLPSYSMPTQIEQESTYYSRGFDTGRILEGQHADGHNFPVEIALSPIKIGGESMVLTTIVDISSRMLTEQKLKQRESYLRILVEQAPIGIIVANMNGIITDTNPYGIKLLDTFNKETTVGIDLLASPSFVEAELSDAFHITITSSKTVEKETWYTSARGKTLYFYTRTVPYRNEDDKQTGILILIEDMTARIKAEEAMLHLQKTESLGVLAGGIAHDFNNLLVAIMAQSSLALLKMMQGDSADRP